jgi:Flp pilus assembly protein TadD
LLTRDPAQLPQALKLAEQAVTLNPELQPAHRLKALLLFQTGDVDAAVSAYRALLDRWPDNSEALNNLAWILAEQGNVKQAEPYARRAVELTPEDPDVHDTLGYVHLLAERTEEARTEFRTSLSLSEAGSRSYATALVHLAKACLKLRDRDGLTQLTPELRSLAQAEPPLDPDLRQELEDVLQQFSAENY